MVRKLLLGLTSLALMASLALGASVATAADSVDHLNDNTGKDSTNKNKSRIKRTRTQKWTTDAKTKNKATVTGSTGGNEAKENTNSGDLTSGKLDTTLTATNSLNQNLPTPPTPPDSALTAVQTNSNTGVDSENRNESKLEEKDDIKVENKADVSNEATITGTTGDNKSNKNTNGGKIDSGDVEVNLTFTNTLN